MPVTGGGGPNFYGSRLDVATANIAGALSAASVNLPLNQGVARVYNVADYGAMGDARWVGDGAITNGSITFSSATANFSQADATVATAKALLVAGAGPSGGVLATTIASYISPTTVTVQNAASATVSNAHAMIASDNQPEFLKAINDQQTYGGILQVPAGQYYFFAPLVPAFRNSNGSYTTASQFPLIIQGAGMASTALIMGAQANFVTTGLLGNVNISQGQVVCSDITFDGNYAGVSNGVIPQPTGTPGDAMVALPWPFTNAFSAVPTAPTGQYHIFTRCRFYRPHQFVFQPTQGILLDDCVLDQCGQPDVASGGLHWDNLGSATGDAIVIGCSWKDSSGNYADFVPASAAVSRIIFIGNVSRNHQIGSLVACGTGSIVAFNRLSNVNAGSGIGYDASQPANTRSKNYVFGNFLDNITVNNASLSFATNGDVVWGNITSDSVGLEIQQGYLNLAQAIGNANSPAIESVSGIGDKIMLAGGAGAGGRFGFGFQTNAMVAVLANVAGAKFSIRDDPGGAAQASSGSEVGYFDANGNLSWSGHLISTAGGTPATSALGANVSSATFTGNDTRGTIAVVMAGALAANTRIATCTFATTYGATSPKVTLVNQTSAVGLTIINFYVSAQSTGVSFDLASDQALAAGTYTIDYIVIG